MGITPCKNLWRNTSPGYHAPSLSGDNRVDLVIIGGGFTGCSAALAAAETGASVCLLEAQKIGHGGAGRNVGLVNAGLWLPPEEVLKTMGAGPGHRLNTALAGAPDMVFSLIKKHEIDCEATRKGTLHLAHAATGLKDLVNRYRQLINIGAEVELLSREETAKRTGSNAFRGALFNPAAGTIQPLAFVQGMARAATHAGAQIFCHSPAQSVRHTGDVWRVETPGGTVHAKALLRATNAYAPGQYVAVNFFQVATQPMPEALRQTLLPGGEGCWDTGRVMSSFRVDQAGRLILGAIGDLEGTGRAIHHAWAARKLAKVFPEARSLAFEYAWDGRIAMTRDHIPKILTEGPNALACMGYSGRGIGPGTLFGAQSAHALLSGDMSTLPVAPTQDFREKMTDIRQGYYETGATLTHLVDARL